MELRREGNNFTKCACAPKGDESQNTPQIIRTSSNEFLGRSGRALPPDSWRAAHQETSRKAAPRLSPQRKGHEPGPRHDVTWFRLVPVGQTSCVEMDDCTSSST